MPTSPNPAVDAAKAQQALCGLAHATRSIDDPRQIYEVLGSLAAAAASLSTSLHHIASFHDGPTRKTAWLTGDSRAGRAAAYKVSWELHRAGEILRHVAESIDQAHEAEATIAYNPSAFPALTAAPHRSAEHGIGM